MNTNIIKVSTLLNETIPPFILGSLYSHYIISSDEKYFCTYAVLGDSKILNTNESEKMIYLNQYLNSVNKICRPYTWLTKQDFNKKYPNIKFKGNKINKFSILILIENDLNIKESSFFNLLFSKIVSNCPWFNDKVLTNEKLSFLRGFMETRASVDLSRQYFSLDYYYKDNFELTKSRILVDTNFIPFNVTNINFRELQNDYLQGIFRNTQFRLNIFWYASNVGFLNPYKALIFKKSKQVEEYSLIDDVYYFKSENIKFREKNNVDERISYYASRILNRKLDKEELAKVRKHLLLDKEKSNNRDNNLKDLYSAITPDECLICGTTKTFTHKKTGRQYFEIHHVISIGNNKTLDDMNNLVKLCKNCHGILKKGVGTKEEQINAIRTIFKKAPNTLEFAKHYFNTTDLEQIVLLTYESLL